MFSHMQRGVDGYLLRGYPLRAGERAETRGMGLNNQAACLQGEDKR